MAVFAGLRPLTSHPAKQAAQDVAHDVHRGWFFEVLDMSEGYESGLAMVLDS